jgi:hypothetical protein
MRRNRLVLLAAVCGALSLAVAAPARADLTGKALKPVVGVKFGMESALGSLLGGTLAGEVTQVEVKREEATKIVVTVSYTGFEGGKLWGEVTTSDRKTHRQIKATSPASIASTPGEMDLAFELDPNAADGTLVKTSYLKISVARGDKAAAAYVKAFEMPKTWQNGTRPENVVVTVTPKPAGPTTASLGATPGVPLPPKVIHPSVNRAALLMPATRALTIQPRTAAMSSPTAAPAPAPAAQPSGGAVRSINLGTTRQMSVSPAMTASPATAKMMAPNTAVETKTAAASTMIARTDMIAIRNFKFGLPAPDPGSTTAPKGAGDTPVEPLAELRSEDIELDPSHVLGVFPAFYPDQNPQSGIFYFLPYSYSLRWSEDSGYDLRMIYSATGSGGAGEVAMAARLDAGLGIKERQIATDLIHAYADTHHLTFNALRALPIDSISVSIADDLRRYNIPSDKIAVTGLADFLGQIDISWITDPVTKENLQQALVEDVGISGRVTLYPSGGKLAPVDVPIQIRLADFVTFGGFRWNRADAWTNRTAYPIKLKYLNALMLDSSSRPIVYSWDLSSARVPPAGRAQWAAASVPGWIDGQAKRIWLEYAVEASCQSCDDAVIRSITGGVSSAGPSMITFHTLTPLADAGAVEINVQVRSRYFDPQSRDLQTKSLTLNADGKDFTVGPIYLGSRQPGESVPGDPLFEYSLSVTMASGQSYPGSNWASSNDLRQAIGRFQLEQTVGALPAPK